MLPACRPAQSMMHGYDLLQQQRSNRIEIGGLLGTTAYSGEIESTRTINSRTTCSRRGAERSNLAKMT